MKLTYENIKKWIENYYSALSTIDGEKDKPRIRDMFAPDFKVRSPLSKVVQNREEWVDRLCAETCRITFSLDPEPLGIMVDERRGWAAVKLAEDFLDKKTKKPVKPKLNAFAIFEFGIDENKVKAKRQLLLGIVGYLN